MRVCVRRLNHKFGANFQTRAVMNYGDTAVPWTRITEHKHFAPWEEHARTVLCREYSRDWRPGDIPYYPIRLVREKALLSRYLSRAAEEDATTFVGRLGTYRYLDMDVTIREALDAARTYLSRRAEGARMPAILQVQA